MKKRVLLSVGLALFTCQDATAQLPRLAASPESPVNQLFDEEYTRVSAATDQDPTLPITISYMHEEKVASPDGEVTVRRPVTVHIASDADLETLNLPDDGKRAAVLTLTARRHAGLLEELKKAETDEEKKEAEIALRENYQKHYAIETWWRQQKLKKLEEELAALKAQVQKRVDSEEKYVEAAMTIAQLHIDGVSITPPVPAAPTQSSGSVPRGVYSPYYSADPLPMQEMGALSSPPSNGNAYPLRVRGEQPPTRILDSEPALPKPSLPLNPADELPAKGNSTSSNLAPERTFGWDFGKGGELNYMIQLSPDHARRMLDNAKNDEIYAVSTMPKELVGRVRTISIRVGSDELPRNPSIEHLGSLVDDSQQDG